VASQNRSGSQNALRTVDQIRDTLRGLVWFQRQLMYRHGLSLVEQPLTAMERRVIRHLLSEKSESGIAATLKQSEHTTHSHIKEIYRKFGVKGRAGLTAIWLSRR
jgi:DNA-binding CsgD family transcriptional regulator